MEVIKLFDIPKNIINDNERQRRVYSVDGISPTILGRSDTAKIMEKRLCNIFGFSGVITQVMYMTKTLCVLH